MGFIGLNHIKWEAPFGHAVEVGWRLGSQYWKKGYTTEGARACLNGYDLELMYCFVSYK
ncbi:N-acetyltransferase [Legionella longbeachae]|nr:N-acetyltransferase [Legionella longbeachae]HBD7399387.1 GNAT family N-acetyltransferase [Legionella pneumophila]ARM32097.1 GNAT family N-acetyltransferase [Legionella longbeachae]QIN34036.1 GNAT family N-acetyltransferase [Legionella longbeachae]QIN37364.1 GNAT family N-acetyltransferase [Legionella longbeachae]